MLIPCYANSASTTDASKQINVEQECSLTLIYKCDGMAFADMPVKLYKVASLSTDFQYTLTDPFLMSGLILNGIQTNDEWNVIRSTLKAHIIADSIDSDDISKTNSKVF